MATLELKVIKPKKVWNPAKMQRDIESAYKEVAEGARADLQSTTATWTHSVKFSVIRVGTSWYVTGGSRLYELISETGAKPHTIEPRGAYMLKFQAIYRAKTSPGRLGSSGGGRSGPVVKARKVRHPGFRPRKFIEAARKKWEPRLIRDVKDAVRKNA